MVSYPKYDASYSFGAACWCRAETYAAHNAETLSWMTAYSIGSTMFPNVPAWAAPHLRRGDGMLIATEANA